MEDNKIEIRVHYFWRIKKKVYNNEDLIKAEIKYEKIEIDDGSDINNYSISIITKEEKQINIFKIQENNKIEDMEGLNNLINFINSYIKNKREII